MGQDSKILSMYHRLTSLMGGKNMEGENELLSLEKMILEYETKETNGDMKPLRDQLRRYIGSCCGEDDCLSLSIAELIGLAADNIQSRRVVGIVILRCMSFNGLIPENNTNNQIDRKIVAIVENGVPDICKFYGIDEKKQNYEKMLILRTIHQSILEKLSVLKAIPPRLDGIISMQSELFRSVNSQIVKAYLNIYNYDTLRLNILSIINGILQLDKIQDDYYGITLTDQDAYIESQIEYCKENRTFFNENFYLPFLSNVKNLIGVIIEQSKTRFECNIKPQSDKIIEKNYPLYESGRVIKVPIVFVNEGPGIALNVEANVFVDNENVVVGSDNIVLGNIPKGQFTILLEFLIAEKTNNILFLLELTWNKVSATSKFAISVEAQIESQSQNIDWAALKKLEPYSTEVAEGDEFVGRKEKVVSLSNRLLKARMQSSYVTGQKRVGKTSLVLAVRNNIISTNRLKNIELYYLEWGDYAHADPSKTVEALGASLADFLIGFIPPEIKIPKLDFQGTLAPLNKLSGILQKVHKHKKFIFILDEFDEIHQEMYRYGPLAEIFFSNIRSLSAKNNIAFILVGGENMPFIISAQGDQLNKFMPEPLDYFNRTDEWEDYVQLIKRPVEGKIDWYDTAITELYNLTNGHPYYTKLLCSRIFSNSRQDRDIEITANEVNRALNHVVSQIDTNVFAHIWKDGILGDREEIPIFEAKRCRFLIAVARTLRRSETLIEDNIYKNEQTKRLQDHEIRPLINDFCRRGVLTEKEGKANFRLPIFRDWLVENGINKLISDKLSEELQDRIESEEDRAYVTSSEIAEITEKFPSYKGQKVSSEDVRAWLQQVEKYTDQRLLFKLISNLRFFDEYEIREKLRLAHSLILRNIEPFVRRRKSDRRTDILITYIDGPGKSGSYYALRYAEENLISSKCVVEPEKVSNAISIIETEGIKLGGLVIIDDIAASGKQLASNLEEFVSANIALMVKNLPIVVVVITATKDGEENIRKTISEMDNDKIDLRICEPIDNRLFAFKKGNKIWTDDNELERAKMLCRNIGNKIYKRAPLGYEKLGLLIVFPNTCPNNSLPILHSGSLKKGWRPLFPRAKN